MGRFKGWTDYALKKILEKGNNIEDVEKNIKCLTTATPKKKIDRSNGIEWVRRVKQALKNAGYEPEEKEFIFSTKRKWRSDVTLKKEKILLEYEGGIFIPGTGHIRGKMYSDNCKKYNEAQMLGYVVLRYTPDTARGDFYEYAVVQDVQRIINNRRGENVT